MTSLSNDYQDGDEVEAMIVDEHDTDTTTDQEGVRISYTIDREEQGPMPGEVVLPSWASGDPQMAVALCLFGDRGAVADVTVTDVVDVHPKPKALHAKGVTVGDFVYWHGVNGHRYEGYVQQTWSNGENRAPGVNDSYHSSECGCWQEPWEYDPEGAY